MAHTTQSLLLRYSEFIGKGKKQKPKPSKRQDSDEEFEDDDVEDEDEDGDEDDDAEKPGTMDIDRQLQPLEVCLNNSDLVLLESRTFPISSF